LLKDQKVDEQKVLYAMSAGGKKKLENWPTCLYQPCGSTFVKLIFDFFLL